MTLIRCPKTPERGQHWSRAATSTKSMSATLATSAQRICRDRFAAGRRCTRTVSLRSLGHAPSRGLEETQPARGMRVRNLWRSTLPTRTAKHESLACCAVIIDFAQQKRSRDEPFGGSTVSHLRPVARVGRDCGGSNRIHRLKQTRRTLPGLRRQCETVSRPAHLGRTGHGSCLKRPDCPTVEHVPRQSAVVDMGCV